MLIERKMNVRYFLPDGIRYLYRTVGGDEGSGLYVGSIGSNENPRLVGFERAAVLEEHPFEHPRPSPHRVGDTLLRQPDRLQPDLRAPRGDGRP